MEPEIQPNEKCKKMQKKLQILCCIHFMLAIYLMITGVGGLMSIITPLILCCAAQKYSYCCIMFYIFYCLMDLIQDADPVGLLLQIYI